MKTYCWGEKQVQKSTQMSEIPKSINFLGREKVWQGSKMCAGGVTNSL